jgi:hypothetical protein
MLSWVAADWHDDRRNRVAKYPTVRKPIDRAIAPTVKHLEGAILRSGKIGTGANSSANSPLLKSVRSDRMKLASSGSGSRGMEIRQLRYGYCTPP